MDSITIYEFLKEKSTIPTGPGSYSNSKEMANSLKAFKKNNSSKAEKKKDVNFYDYDGTLIDSYSTEEFLQLSTMPANPSHDGLTAQGWNYTLSDAKEYVSDYGKLDIGQMYITDDGKTRIHIKLEEGRLKPCLGLDINGSVVIDWGDNSQTDTMTGSDLTTTVYQEHEYSAPGEYTISIAVTGKIVFLSDTVRGSQLLMKKASGSAGISQVYMNSIRLIELGNNITSIGEGAFSFCCCLTNVVIPNNVTSIGEGAFSDCSSLTNVVIPNNVTSIGQYAFDNCRSLTNVVIPNNVTSIGEGAFSDCSSLTNVVIPNNVTSIGQYAFNNCHCLTNVVIPNSVTSIGGEGAFSFCHSLTNVVIPNNVTSIGQYAFQYCGSLTNVVIPNSVTSIGMGAFQYCSSLTNVVIPNSVTSIGMGAFEACFGLGFIKFESSTPAEILGTDAWDSIPNDCIIYIPQGSLIAYTSNNTYPNSSTYTYIEY